MSSSSSTHTSVQGNILMAGINFNEGTEKPVILLYRKDEHHNEWSHLISSLAQTHTLYIHALTLRGSNEYHAIEHATKGITYRMLADPSLATKDVMVIIHLRPLDFQSDIPAAIFVDHRVLRGLLESYLGQKLNTKLVDRLLFPSSIVSVLKDMPAQFAVDTITFINDPISFFTIKRLSNFIILNKSEMRIYFLTLIANKRLMRSGVIIDMISALERLKVPKMPEIS